MASFSKASIASIKNQLQNPLETDKWDSWDDFGIVTKLPYKTLRSASAIALEPAKEALTDLWGELTGQVETAPQGLPARGEISNFQKVNPGLEKVELQRRLNQWSSLEANQQRVTDRLIEEDEMTSELAGMPEDKWNKLLNFNQNFSRKHTKGKPYYLNEGRKKLIEQEKAEKAKRAQQLPVPKGKPPIGVDIEAIGEGGTGRGSLNISATGGGGIG